MNHTAIQAALAHQAIHAVVVAPNEQLLDQTLPMKAPRPVAAYTLAALALSLDGRMSHVPEIPRASLRDIGPAVSGTLKQPYVDAKGRRYYTDEKGRVRRLR